MINNLFSFFSLVDIYNSLYPITAYQVDSSDELPYSNGYAITNLSYYLQDKL